MSLTSYRAAPPRYKLAAPAGIAPTSPRASGVVLFLTYRAKGPPFYVVPEAGYESNQRIATRRHIPLPLSRKMSLRGIKPSQSLPHLTMLRFLVGINCS